MKACSSVCSISSLRKDRDVMTAIMAQIEECNITYGSATVSAPGLKRVEACEFRTLKRVRTASRRSGLPPEGARSLAARQAAVTAGSAGLRYPTEHVCGVGARTAGGTNVFDEHRAGPGVPDFSRRRWGAGGFLLSGELGANELSKGIQRSSGSEQWEKALWLFVCY
ncbi:hypothetical protein AAFF_G00175350 [Aldrovandia affinis]|uniref:Uncharacterized protein n=1 Tax=Aldrovandia affinis TaxID=143900 RepID=A0AAD7RLC8_9TELE|nr:hypothetical protein AAFF_G00175350 [Aldrovandia affinis]